MYLSSLFDHLDEYVGNIVRSVGHYDVRTHVKTCFLQMFLWERFGAVLLKPHKFPAVEIVEKVIPGTRTERRNNLYKPRALQWIKENKQITNF